MSEGEIVQCHDLQCSVLLFVIGGDTLSVSSMVEVAYHMGQVRRLVLAVSDIPRPSGDATGTTHLEGMKVCIYSIIAYVCIYTIRMWGILMDFGAFC